jgi:hypothetical protein
MKIKHGKGRRSAHPVRRNPRKETDVDIYDFIEEFEPSEFWSGQTPIPSDTDPHACHEPLTKEDVEREMDTNSIKREGKVPFL